MFGLDGALPCPPGQLGSQTGLTSAVCAGACPPGSYCERGSTAAIPCPSTTYNNRSGAPSLSACLPTPPPYLSALGSCFYCQGGDFCSTHNDELGECECTAGFFLAEPGGSLCTLCPAGIACTAAGTTLATTDVRRDFWRPSTTSSDARTCPYDGTCAGGVAAPSHYDAASTATCVEGRGLSGVFCTLCANATAAHGGSYFYFREARAACEACVEEPLRLLAGMIGGIGGAIVLCVILRWWLRARRHALWERFVDAVRRAWHRAANGRPAFKIVFGFCHERNSNPIASASAMILTRRRPLRVAQIKSWRSSAKCI